MGGGYSPSPGVIYPTLSPARGHGLRRPRGRGRTQELPDHPEGAALAANRGAFAEIEARMGKGGGRRSAPEPVLRAMEDIF